MSMRPAPFAEAASTGDYVVVAPQRADILSETLRCAYETESDLTVHFSDLIYQLDRIDAIPIQR